MNKDKVEYKKINMKTEMVKLRINMPLCRGHEKNANMVLLPGYFVSLININVLQHSESESFLITT